MDIRDPEPETEEVIDLDFCFLGNVQTNLTLVPAKGDSITWSPEAATIIKGIEKIEVFKRNILYFASRTRQRALPAAKSPLKLVDKPATLPPS